MQYASTPRSARGAQRATNCNGPHGRQLVARAYVEDDEKEPWAPASAPQPAGWHGEPRHAHTRAKQSARSAARLVLVYGGIFHVQQLVRSPFRKQQELEASVHQSACMQYACPVLAAISSSHEESPVQVMGSKDRLTRGASTPSVMSAALVVAGMKLGGG